MRSQLALLLLLLGTGCWYPKRNYHHLLWARYVADVGYAHDRWFDGNPATDGRLLFIDIGGAIAALDVRNGEQRWVTRFREDSNPRVVHFVIQGDRLLFAVPHTAVALNRIDGRMLWITRVDSLSAYTESSSDSSAFYVGTLKGDAIALDRLTGAILWQTSLRDSSEFLVHVTGVAVTGDTAFAAGEQWRSSDGRRRRARIAALDRRTGRQLWMHESDDHHGVSGGGALAARTIIYSDVFGRSFFALDRVTGRELWRVTGDTSSGSSGPSASPIVRGDTVYVGSGDSWVYAANVNTGNVYWRTQTSTSIAAIAMCRELLLARNQVIEFLERGSGRLHQSYPTDTHNPSGYVMSGIAIADDIAMVAATDRVFGFRCGKHARD